MENLQNVANSRQSVGGQKKVAFTNAINPHQDEKRKSSLYQQSNVKKRVSFSLRGKRKSSYAEVQSTVHPEISPKDFHKHLNTELPDPLKLRQIIVFSISHYVTNVTCNDKVAVLLNVLMNMLLEKQVSTSWFTRPRSSKEGMVISLPNPANKELSARILGYKDFLNRLEQDNLSLTVLTNINQESKSNGKEELMIQEGKSVSTNLTGDAQMVPKFLPSLLHVTPDQMFQSIEKIHFSLSSYQNFAKIQSHLLKSKFVNAINACWEADDAEKDEKLLEPFSIQYARAGRRLSFNIQKGDECVKLLRAFALTKQT